MTTELSGRAGACFGFYARQADSRTSKRWAREADRIGYMIRMPTGEWILPTFRPEYLPTKGGCHWLAALMSADR